LTGIVFKESQIPPTRQKQYPKNFLGKRGGGCWAMHVAIWKQTAIWKQSPNFQ